jgi:hypothetical protein
MISLLLRLAYLNHRSVDRGLDRIAVQAACIAVALVGATLLASGY